MILSDYYLYFYTIYLQIGLNINKYYFFYILLKSLSKLVPKKVILVQSYKSTVNSEIVSFNDRLFGNKICLSFFCKNRRPR